MPSVHIAFQLLRRTIGSKRGLLLNVLLPAIILSVLAGLFGSPEERAVIAMSIADEGELGSSLAAALSEEQLFDVRVLQGMSEEQLEQEVLDGAADAAVYVPAGFTEAMMIGEISPAVLYRESLQLWNASLAAKLETESRKLASAALMAREGGQASRELAASRLSELLAAANMPTVTTEHSDMKLGQILSEPAMVGLMLMFVMLLVSQSVGFVMEDKEQRTMARIYTAPVRAIDISLGNFLGSFAVGTLQLIIMLSLTFFVFGYDPGVSFGGMLLVLECFLLAAVGFAIAIGGMVRDSKQLNQINYLVLSPACMISGCFFPLSMLPEFMQKLANFTPQKWALQAIDRLGGGGGVADIGMQLAILLLFAAVLTAFGAAVLRHNKLN